MWTMICSVLERAELRITFVAPESDKPTIAPTAFAASTAEASADVQARSEVVGGRERDAW
jgi:hypothetical protein